MYTKHWRKQSQRQYQQPTLCPLHQLQSWENTLSLKKMPMLSMLAHNHRPAVIVQQPSIIVCMQISSTILMQILATVPLVLHHYPLFKQPSMNDGNCSWRKLQLVKGENWLCLLHQVHLSWMSLFPLLLFISTIYF